MKRSNKTDNDDVATINDYVAFFNIASGEYFPSFGAYSLDEPCEDLSADPLVITSSPRPQASHFVLFRDFFLPSLDGVEFDPKLNGWFTYANHYSTCMRNVEYAWGLYVKLNKPLFDSLVDVDLKSIKSTCKDLLTYHVRKALMAYMDEHRHDAILAKMISDMKKRPCKTKEEGTKLMLTIHKLTILLANMDNLYLTCKRRIEKLDQYLETINEMPELLKSLKLK